VLRPPIRGATKSITTLLWIWIQREKDCSVEKSGETDQASIRMVSEPAATRLRATQGSENMVQLSLISRVLAWCECMSRLQHAS